MDPITGTLVTGAVTTGFQLAVDWYRARTGIEMPEEERQRLIAEGRDTFGPAVDGLGAALAEGRPEEAAAMAARDQRKEKRNA